MSDPQPVLFIGGLGRSGTTLIERILNELPSAFGVGETVHLWERGLRNDERCGCGKPFSSCEHWSEVGRAALGGWDQIDVDRMIELRWSVDRTRRLPLILSRRGRTPLSADEAEYLAGMRRVLVGSAEVAAASAPRPVLVESSKHVSTAALLSLDPGLDLRVLHVVRDPRGVAHSWTKSVDRPEVTEHGTDRQMPQYSPSRTARRWVSDNLGFEALGRLGVATMRLRYEDFVADPVGALDAICIHAGIEPHGAGPDRYPFLVDGDARVETPLHSVAGNPLRFGGEHLTLRVDETWREGLSPSDRRTVTRVCAPLLRRYGYTR